MKEFQELLDRHHQLEGEILDIERRIEVKEIEYLSNTWTEGNYVLGWHQHKADASATRKSLDISAKDKRFSLSSTFRRPSL